MKDVLKLTGITVIGLFTAIILYPFLHESGHSLIAILVGADVLEYQILPLPYILCNVENVHLSGQVLIGFAGMGFPILFSAVLSSKHFWIWYVGILLSGISVLAILISMAAVILFWQGYPMHEEDIVQVLKIWPNGEWCCLLVLLLLTISLIGLIIKSHPFKRIVAYFEFEI